MLRGFPLFTFALLTIATVLLSSCTALQLVAPAAQAAESSREDSCPVTPTVVDKPPDDPHADPFVYGTWHINADRTLWVYIPPSGVWHTGGEKVIWIRPAGTELRVRGERIDAQADPLVVDQPCCYPTGFQVNGLHFPTTGCWEITATAGDHALRFVIEVLHEDAAHAREQRGVPLVAATASSIPLQFCDRDTCELRLFNAVTGAVDETFAPLELGRYATFGPAADLTKLAVISYRGNGELRNGQLNFVDLATWQSVTTTLTFDGAYSAPRFAQDNARLLVVTQTERYPVGDIVHLVDVASGTLLAESALNFYPAIFQFTPDERGIMFFGTKGATAKSFVALLDANTLELLWESEVAGVVNGVVMPEGSTDPMQGRWWQPAYVFAPDKPALYLVHADRDALTTVDFATEQIETTTITKRISWIERLLLLTATTAHAKVANGVTKQAMMTPDGTRLYVIGTDQRMEENGEFIQQGLGLQVIDVTTSQAIAHADTDAQSLTLDPSSGRIFLHGWSTGQSNPYTQEWTAVLDADTLAEITVEPRAVAVARRLDGTPVLLATTLHADGRTELVILDPQTFAPVTAWTESLGNDYLGWLVLR